MLLPGHFAKCLTVLLCGHHFWHANKGHADVRCTHAVLLMMLSLHHNQNVTTSFPCPCSCGLEAAWTPHVTLFSHHNQVTAVANADLLC